jgi:RHS repeat-associated protein
VNTGDVLVKATQNAGALEHANQQLGDQAGPTDVWTHTYDGMSARMREFADDPIGTLARADRNLDRAVAAGLSGDWHASSPSAVADSIAAQAAGLDDAVKAIGDAKGALATVGATFALLTGLEQMLSTLVSVIPFPALPAIRVMDMDVGLPHAHAHPPNLVPPAPPVPLPSTGPIIPIPILSGATRTLINGMPAARCGDMGLGIWCGGYFPMYEVFLGSSSVWIEGSRAGRLAVDITKHCIFTSPKPSDPPMGPMIGVTTMASGNVLIGGVPMPSLLSLALGAAIKGLAKGLGKLAKVAAASSRRLAQRVFRNMKAGFLKCKVFRAEPVDVVTGEVVVDQRDFAVPGRIPIDWSRHYGSHSSRLGVCGHGWETPADARLVFEDDGSVVFHDGSGMPTYFPGVPVRGPVREAVDGALLERRNGRFVVRTKRGLQHLFGRRIGGARETLIRQTRDLWGNWVGFVRDGNGLRRVEESGGRVVEVTSANGFVRRLDMRLRDSADVRHLASFDYDNAGNLVAVRDALDAEYRFDYHGHRLVRHTDRNGLSFHYEYDRRSPAARCVHTWGDGGLYDYHFSYATSQHRTVIVDSRAQTWQVHYNNRLEITEEIDPLGGVTRYGYDEAGRTSVVVDPGGHRREYAYDDRGNLVGFTLPDRGVVTTVYDERSLATAITDFNGNCWRLEWDARHLLSGRTSPRGATWTYESNTHGDLIGVTNPVGSRLTLRRDGLGNVTAVTDALGFTTSFEYDLLGSVTSSTDPLGAVTRFFYDAASRLSGTLYPDGRRVSAARDRSGNLIAFTDEVGRTTSFEYTGLGELSRRIQADGTTLSYRYDTEENLLAIVNERGEEYSFVRDALGRVTTEIDYWGNRREQKWDAAGRLAESIDPLGRTTSYRFDASGRLRGKRYSTGGEEQFDYDPNGNLVRFASDGVAVTRVYNADNQLVEESQDGFTIKNTYDLNGNRTSRTSRFGHEVHYRYDLNGLVTGVAIDDRPRVAWQRDARGAVVAETVGAGLRRTFDYDRNGRLIGQKVQAPAARSHLRRFGYDEAGNLVERYDSRRGADRYAYDALNRVVEHRDAGGLLERFVPDVGGDLLREAAQHTDPGGDRVLSSGQARYRFDACGNLVERNGSSAATAFRWDGDNRLVLATRPNLPAVEMTYDALGRRTSKKAGDHTTRFYWDGDHLLGDHSPSSGSREFVFVPGTFAPLACLLNDGSIVYYRNDSIGLPCECVDESGETLWSAAYTDFASARVTSAGFDNPIRLQGQYYDRETGLSYNRHRHFDHFLGAFVSQDPLRTVAGEHLYQYAPNIWTWRDPLGLTCEKLALGFWGDQLVAFRQWADKHGLKHLAGGGFPATGPAGFGDHMKYLMDRAGEIHVRLDGMLDDGVLKVPDNAHVLDVYGNPVNGFTNYEMYLIKSGHVPADKVKWHLGDHQFKDGFSPFE